jgi:hypothetical protein
MVLVHTTRTTCLHYILRSPAITRSSAVLTIRSCTALVRRLTQGLSVSSLLSLSGASLGLTWTSEGILNQDPHVKCAVMFGRGKFNVGVVIEPKPQYAFDPSDKEKLTDFRNKIWYVSVQYTVQLSLTPCNRPTVERMNEYAPQHSRLFKEVSRYYFASLPTALTPL